MINKNTIIVNMMCVTHALASKSINFTIARSVVNIRPVTHM